MKAIQLTNDFSFYCRNLENDMEEDLIRFEPEHKFAMQQFLSCQEPCLAALETGLLEVPRHSHAPERGSSERKEGKKRKRSQDVPKLMATLALVVRTCLATAEKCADAKQRSVVPHVCVMITAAVLEFFLTRYVAGFWVVTAFFFKSVFFCQVLWDRLAYHARGKEYRRNVGPIVGFSAIDTSSSEVLLKFDVRRAVRAVLRCLRCIPNSDAAAARGDQAEGKPPAGPEPAELLHHAINLLSFSSRTSSRWTEDMVEEQRRRRW